jgi:hypothetical protein
VAGRDEGQCVILPSLLVEVSGQEPAGFIRKKRIHANRFLAGQV